MTGKRLLGVALAAPFAILVVVVVVVVAATVLPLPPGIQRPASQVVEAADGTWLRIFTTADGGGMWRVPVSRDELPAHLVQAVLTFEDQRFYRHPGVDPLALIRAAGQAVRAGRIISGGSTLTMQIARMLERRPRTVRSKLIEMFHALQLELRYSKDELLTMYFDLAPYGGNIEGVGAAAWFYFGKQVAQLNLEEAASLAALPNAPTLLRPDRDPARLRRRRDDVLARMAAAGVVDTAAARRASQIEVTAERRAAPMLAPHFTQRVHRARPGVPRVRTTLDASLQHRVSRLLADHVDGIAAHGISNGAVVVLDNETAAVKAYVGSRGFFDAAIDGQVDGAAAPRSPGSTLKPFVYAAALDLGLIGRRSLIQDVPLNFRDWSPSNFDSRFRGLVAAEDALAQSLNVPAVQVARMLEPEGLVAMMRRLGVSTFGDDRQYGLAAVLGGCEINLLELTGLYAALASGGRHLPPVLVPGERAPQRLVSPAAAYLISDILTDVRRPELPEVWRHATSANQLAWKTGTSYGRRDAWSVGYTRRYTIGVWIGNFDGHGVPELVGVQVAAPLLFAIARVLPGADDEGWIDRPETVVERSVCSVSGAPAGPHCPHQVGELAIEGVAPRTRCKLHVQVDVHDDSGLRLCSRCRAGRDHHPEVHTVWPAAVVPWLSRAGVGVGALPPHDPSCASGLDGAAPVIHTPSDGDEFVLRSGVPSADQQIALQASTSGGTGAVFWFVDGALQTQAAPGDVVLLEPTPGPHHLVAVDTEGRSADIRITVHR